MKKKNQCRDIICFRSEKMLSSVSKQTGCQRGMNQLLYMYAQYVYNRICTKFVHLSTQQCFTCMCIFTFPLKCYIEKHSIEVFNDMYP